MKCVLVLSVFFLCILTVSAQQTTSLKAENIVPNPGFERYASTPIGWFYKGRHFTNVMKYWSSATGASPDVFGPKVRVPAHWAAKGFGNQAARSGESMVGITLYGCKGGKPHCREYLQIQLSEPLVVGQKYLVEFWASHLPRSLQINNLGAYFSPLQIGEKTDVPLHFSPHINVPYIVSSSSGGWTRVSGHFQAEQEANYLIIGNFFPDSLTRIRVSASNPLNYAYYYIDDVLVKKIEPVLAVPVPEDDLSRAVLVEGSIVPLKNIFFDHDKAELLPRSYVELRKLLHIMQTSPRLVIEVIGHTDSVGKAEYNLFLSQRRARAVVDFLLANGIAAQRCLYKGYGSQLPIASNTTDGGRQMNRRVEFLVVSK